MALTSHSALAACPGDFLGLACNGDTGGDVCTRVDANTIECDLAAGITIDSNTTSFYVSPSNTTFRAYGYEGDGEAFCCELGSLTDGCTNNPIDIEIVGTDFEDTIKLENVILSEYLDCSTTVVKADASDDEIVGSPSTDNNDWLYGEDDSDVIRGQDGDDYIDGGDGDDWLSGQGHADTIVGGWGADHIKGGAGDDDLSGDGGNDAICGGVGDDDLFGGDDDDKIEGEGGTDTNDGGGGALNNDTCEDDNPNGCDWLTTTDATCSW
jgi:Ca2+-binding RTX toxin-like protein